MTFSHKTMSQIEIQTLKLVQKLQVSSTCLRNQQNRSQKETNKTTTNQLLSLTSMIPTSLATCNTKVKRKCNNVLYLIIKSTNKNIKALMKAMDKTNILQLEIEERH